MTIRLSNAKLPAAGLALGALLFPPASHSYAGPQVGGAGVRPQGAVVLVGEGDSGECGPPEPKQEPIGPCFDLCGD